MSDIRVASAGPRDGRRPIQSRIPSLGGAVAVAALALAASARDAWAQTDYYNTDAGRPIQVEDAYAIERRAVELQVAPLRLERARGGIYSWGLEPKLALGLLPRTQVEVGLPVAYVDAGLAGHAGGLAGVELSALHNLNVETAIPALAVAADVLVPAGGLGPDRAYPSVKGIATKTFSRARFHVNGQYTFGDRLPARAAADASLDRGGAEPSRWFAGAAVDRTFPLRALLVTGEIVAAQPLRAAEDVAWHTAAGLRYQLSPRVATDAGGGYRFTGGDQGWFVTFGTAVAVGVPWSGR
jgi:hypothetical protein